LACRVGTSLVFGSLYYKAATHGKKEGSSKNVDSSKGGAGEKIIDPEKQPLTVSTK
jgi:hypothetical protein